jgi:hypothetical protein
MKGLNTRSKRLSIPKKATLQGGFFTSGGKFIPFCLFNQTNPETGAH